MASFTYNIPSIVLLNGKTNYLPYTLPGAYFSNSEASGRAAITQTLGETFTNQSYCQLTFAPPTPPIAVGATGLSLNIDVSLDIVGPLTVFSTCLCRYSLDGGTTWTDVINVTNSSSPVARATTTVPLTWPGQDITKIILESTIIPVSPTQSFTPPQQPIITNAAHTIWNLWVTVTLSEPPVGLLPNPQAYLFLLPVYDQSKPGPVNGNGSLRTYLGTFDSDNLQCEATSFWVFPQVDVTEGTKPTVQRVRIKYRNLGPFTLTCGLLNQQNPGVQFDLGDIQTSIQVPAPGGVIGGVPWQVTKKMFGNSDLNTIGLIYTDYFDIIGGGESPYIYIACNANNGPVDLISVAMYGVQGEGPVM